MTDTASTRKLDIEPRHRERRRVRRARFSFGAVFLGMLLGVVMWIMITGVFPSLNPFQRETRDYSPPVMLQQLRDMAEFHAAQAQFQETIDVEDDVKYIPSIIAGERVQYLAVGYVDGYVDFSDIGEQAVTIDEATNSVTIDLPAPVISEPVIDLNLSHVMNRDRGLVDRLSGAFKDNPTGEQELIQLAQAKMAAAAKESDLLARTESNTAEMLRSMVGAMGFDEVVVTFDGVEPEGFVLPDAMPGGTIVESTTPPTLE